MESAVIILIVIIICIFGIKSYARRLTQGCCIFGIKSYARRLTQGCCGAGGDAQKRVRVRDKNKEHYPYCVKIGVDGMTCSHCRERVENALNQEEGVWAQVNLKEGSAVVRMKRELSREELERIIRRAGYTMKE